MKPELVPGLERYLAEQRGKPVTISNVVETSAGARRRNVLFDAAIAGETLELCATITPSAAIQMLPTVDETESLRVAEEFGVPVPHVFHVELDPSYVGGPFFISQRVAGETVPRKVLRLVEASGIGPRVAEQCGEAFARLHSIPLERAPKAFARPDSPPAERALANAAAQLDALWQPSPALAFGLRWLERRLPRVPENLVIVHGDFRNGNIIVDKTGLRALLDWEITHLGDPMEDLSWICLRTWRFGKDALEAGGFSKRGDLLAGYARAGGRYDPHAFHWWKVLGTLRWGLGLAGQAIGHMNGSVRNIVMCASGKRVAELEYDLLALLAREYGEG